MADPTYRHLPVAVHVETVAVERYLWCTACRLSSAARVWVAVSLGDKMHLQLRLWCYDCKSGAHVLDPRA